MNNNMENSMDEFMDEFINSYNSSLIDFLNDNSVSQIILRLDCAKDTVEYWNKYQNDRKREEALSQNSESDVESSIVSAIMRTFSTKKLSKSEEEKLKEIASFSEKLLNSVYENTEFIDALSEKMDEIEYDTEDISSRSNLVSSIISVQKFINNSSDEKWQELKETIGERIKELSSEDYKMLYQSLNTRQFFSDKSYESANIEQIKKMSLEQFCEYLYNISDGRGSTLNGIKELTESMIEKYKKSNPKFFNQFVNQNYYFTFPEENFKEIETATDSIVFLDLDKMRMAVYYKPKEEIPKYEQLYLKALRNANELQFTYFLYKNLNTGTFYEKSLNEDNEEMRIIKERILKLDTNAFIALVDHFKLGMPQSIKEALTLRGYTEIPENTKRSEVLTDLFKSIRSGFNLSYSNFDPLNQDHYGEDKDSDESISESYQENLQTNEYNEYLTQTIRFLSELDDNNFVYYVIKYNKENPINDKETETSSSSKDPIANAHKVIESYMKRRIISLPRKLRQMLLPYSFKDNGVLTPTILLSNMEGATKSNDTDGVPNNLSNNSAQSSQDDSDDLLP